MEKKKLIGGSLSTLSQQGSSARFADFPNPWCFKPLHWLQEYGNIIEKHGLPCCMFGWFLTHSHTHKKKTT